MTGRLWPSAMAAAIFALHPLRTESVAWAIERKDVLSGLFFMLALWAYADYARRGFSLVRYFAVLLLFALGLMAKPSLVTLPFVLLLLDYWPLRRMEPTPPDDRLRQAWRLIVEKIPLFALSIASCIATIYAQGRSVTTMESVTLSQRFSNAVVSYAAYLGDFFCPTRLALFYPYPKNGWATWQVVGALLALTAVSAGALRLSAAIPLSVRRMVLVSRNARAYDRPGAGRAQARADRYTYLPQIGLAVALTSGAADLCQWQFWRRWRRWIGGAASAALLAALATLAWRQTALWRDGEILWRHALQCTSKNVEAQNNLGIYLAKRGRFAEAGKEYQKGLEISPGHIMILNNYAWLLATCPVNSMRNGAKAVEFARRASLAYDDQNPGILDTLAAAYAEAGRFPEALQAARAAIHLALQKDNRALVEQVRARSRLYEQGKPFHER